MKAHASLIQLVIYPAVSSMWLQTYIANQSLSSLCDNQFLSLWQEIPIPFIMVQINIISQHTT